MRNIIILILTLFTSLIVRSDSNPFGIHYNYNNKQAYGAGFVFYNQSSKLRFGFDIQRGIKTVNQDPTYYTTKPSILNSDVLMSKNFYTKDVYTSFNINAGYTFMKVLQPYVGIGLGFSKNNTIKYSEYKTNTNSIFRFIDDNTNNKYCKANVIIGMRVRVLESIYLGASYQSFTNNFGLQIGYIYGLYIQ